MEPVHIGDATLYLGDCMDILPTLGKVDAVITDPPYGIGFKYDSHDDRPEAYEGGYDAWLMRIISCCEGLCNPGCPIFIWQAAKHIKYFGARFPRDFRIFIAAKNFTQIYPIAMQYSFDPVVCWWTDGPQYKSAHGDKRDFHVANTAPVMGQSNPQEFRHPCPRPLGQMKHVTHQWCRQDGTVLDPFMGSGTTGVAAIQLGRKFIGIEKDPKYFDIACKRIEQAVAQGQLFKPEVVKPVQEALFT
jgi:site-specific DNA-methyltransferase (adenine-specific)